METKAGDYRLIYQTKESDKYTLTTNQLQKLVRDFQVDCFDGFVSNDASYIEEWVKKNVSGSFIIGCGCECASGRKC